MIVLLIAAFSYLLVIYFLLTLAQRYFKATPRSTRDLG